MFLCLQWYNFLWGVFSFPQVVVDLVQAAGAGLAVLGLGRGEGSGLWLGSRFRSGHGGVRFPDLPVDSYCGLLLHEICNVGVNVQGGG